MNPNPYRTALLALGIVGLGLGAILSAYGAANYPELGFVGGIVLVVGAVLMTLWLLVSAIIVGITGTGKRPGFSDWLGTPSDEDGT